MFEHINFKDGKVKYDDFDINPNKTFEEQLFSYKQDLFQVTYPERYTIDIGWYPEFKKDGEFVLVIIKDYDWDNPVFEKCCKNIETLERYLKEAIDLIDNLLKSKENK